MLSFVAVAGPTKRRALVSDERGSKKPFAPESEEASNSNSSDDSSTSDVKPSALNFGWQNLHAACKSQFLKDAAKAGKQVKPRRAYDNSKRVAGAAYSRKRDVFKARGLCMKRLATVLGNDRCWCC